MTDPYELETRFSQQDGMAYIENIFDVPSEESLDVLDRLRDIIENLPPREADFVDLYYFKKKKQTDIAAIFGVSQPTVCYRLQRATARIQFLLQLPEIGVKEIEEAMDDFLDDPLDVKIMTLMYSTTCQSEVGKKLGVSQGKIRHRFIRSIEKMKKYEEMEHFAELFEIISNNLNILREVRRSSKSDPTIFSLD